MKFYYIIFFLLLLPFKTTAQLGRNAQFILDFCASQSDNGAGPQKQWHEKNEVAFVASLLLGGYQRFISSQDKSVCIFATSCSHFSQLAIREKGFFKGTLLTADRLTRCNTRALRYYQVDPVTHRRLDTVILYYLYNQKSKQE